MLLTVSIFIMEPDMQIQKLPIYNSFRVLLFEILTIIKHRIGIFQCKKFIHKRSLRLHFGCGNNKKEGWINIDLSRKADVVLDLRKPIPLSTSSCSMIYSEHFLEHLAYPTDALPFLSECYRLLAPGGIFSVGVPDTEGPLKNYTARADGKTDSSVKKQGFPEWCETPMDYINYHFRQDGEHLFAYDFEALENALTKAGFRNIHKRNFDPGLDSQKRKAGTLYVDAYVPVKK